MRYLILSDIHANRQALEAVLEHAEGRYDEVLCCGDLVGYGADPGAVVDWTRTHLSKIVRGNHDKACSRPEELEWFNPAARISAEWTLHQLNEEQLAYLRNLPQGPIEVGNAQLLHGSPLDEDEYLINVVDVRQQVDYLQSSISFFGHTHIQGGFLCHRNGIMRLAPAPGDQEEYSFEIEPDLAYLVNPGSVGQPRDGDPRAAYVIYTPAEKLITYRRARYDIEGAQRRIRDAGLPDLLSERLAVGR